MFDGYKRSIAVNIASTDQTPTMPSAGLYVGGAGNLVCRLRNDTADTTFTGLLVGQVYQIEISIVRKTNTTITNSLLLY
jgi:hypothetical protein